MSFSRLKPLLPLIIVAPIAWFGASAIPFNTQGPKYIVRAVETDPAYEIRTYTPYIKAQIAIAADDYEDAIKRGSTELEIYFQGENSRRKAVKRTDPIFVREIDPKKLTSPVRVFPELNQTQGKKPRSHFFWVHYILWPTYTMSGIPKPNNPYIALIDYNTSQSWAAHSFKGTPTEKSIQENALQLKEALARDGIEMTNFVVEVIDPWWVYYKFKRNCILSYLGDREQ